MSVLPPCPVSRNPDPPRPDAAPALAAYTAALQAYQQRRTVEGKATLFRAYQQWIRSFLDDEGEVNRAAVNFMVALRTPPPESREAA